MSESEILLRQNLKKLARLSNITLNRNSRGNDDDILCDDDKCSFRTNVKLYMKMHRNFVHKNEDLYNLNNNENQDQFVSQPRVKRIKIEPANKIINLKAEDPIEEEDIDEESSNSVKEDVASANEEVASDDDGEISKAEKDHNDAFALKVVDDKHEREATRIDVEQDVKVEDSSAKNTTSSDAIEFKCTECDFKTRQWRPFKWHCESDHKLLTHAKCHFCRKDLALSHYFIRHIRSHEQRAKSYDCAICDCTAKTATQFKRHFEENHDVKDYKCTSCGEIFGSIDDLIKHIKTLHFSNEVSGKRRKLGRKCPKCDFWGKSLKRHRNKCNAKSNEEDTESGSDPGRLPRSPLPLTSDLNCRYCDFKCRTVVEYYRHCVREHDLRYRELPCGHCDKGFDDYRLLVRHIRAVALTSESEKKLCCSECGLKTSTLSRLFWHLRSDHGRLKSFKCTMGNCNATYGDLSGLLSHTFNAHLGGESKQKNFFNLECAECSFRTCHLVDYRRHCRQEHGDEALRHRCAECGRTFGVITSLYAHLMRHHSVNSNREVEQIVVEPDVGIHTDPDFDRGDEVVLENEGKMQRRDENGNSFGVARKSAKIVFNCGVCDFVTHGGVKYRNHCKNEHNAEMLPCGLCNRICVNLSDLRKHIKGTHVNIQYDCFLCSFVTKSKYYLKLHLKKLHDAEPFLERDEGGNPVNIG